MGWRFFLFLFLCGVCAAPAVALRVRVSAPVPFVYVQVGHGLISGYGMFGGPASLIDEVVFNFPAGVQPGDGTAVVGTPVIPIAFLGYSGSNRSNYRVTIDSSGGLINGNGERMPFSEFSWTTEDGNIPGGQFDNSATQFLQQYAFRGRRGAGVVDYLSFAYRNTQIYPSGDYSGRVVFTVTNL